jgi:hypothetical protein
LLPDGGYFGSDLTTHSFGQRADHLALLMHHTSLTWRGGKNCFKGRD